MRLLATITQPTEGTFSVHGPALREPIRRFHWAGTETARYCIGFIEGAVESGQRAATEVLSSGV
jgi:monoamine oxidase